MNDHLAKPISPERLWAALRQWIAPRPGLGVAPGQQQPARAPVVVAALDIDGLDSIQGLKRVLGKETVYLRLLRKFAAGQKHAPGLIRDALAGGDTATAERAAHSLKGLAGTIGALALQQDAAALEASLRERQSRQSVDVLLGAVGARLAALVARIEQSLPEDTDAGQAVADLAVLPAVLHQLAELLRNDDFEAGHVLERHKALLGGAMGGRFAEMAACVAEFEFDRALELLGGVRASGEDLR